MDKYLKMSDVKDLFDGLVADGYELWCESGWIGEMLDHDSAEYAAHAINSHDELVENMQHYKQESEQWEIRATKEASRAQDLEAEVERLRRQLEYAFMAGWEEGVNGMECEEAQVASVEIAEQFARN